MTYEFLWPVAIAIFFWWLNEIAKRSYERRVNKDKNYRELLLHLRVFYRTFNRTSEEAEDKKEKFIEQLQLCWLYGADDVIKKANAFVETVYADSIDRVSNEDKQKALGDFVAAIRKDNLHRFEFKNAKKWKRTELTGRDFKHLC